MRYLDYVLVALIVIASIGALFVYNLNQTTTPEDTCALGTFACSNAPMHGETPPSPCTTPEECGRETTDTDVTSTHASTSKHIRLFSPKPGEKITSPITLTGEARGYWFFEASFPVRLTTPGGDVVIGEGIATANSEWMTEDFVPFTATIHFDNTPYIEGGYAPSFDALLILTKENPSGLSENDDALFIPVTF